LGKPAEGAGFFLDEGFLVLFCKKERKRFFWKKEAKTSVHIGKCWHRTVVTV
jgi:hypothetical protein